MLMQFETDIMFQTNNKAYEIINTTIGCVIKRD